MMATSRTNMTGEALFSPNDISRLFQLVADIADRGEMHPAEVIEQLEHRAGATPPAAPATAGGIRLGEFVGRLRRIRMKRNDVIGVQLFRDPAWDMLLDLFAAHELGQRVSVSALCFASGVPQSTALRTVQRLEERDLLEREGDPEDLRRSWVRATPNVLSGIATMAGLFAEAVLASAEPTPPRYGPAMAFEPYEEFDLFVPLT